MRSKTINITVDSLEAVAAPRWTFHAEISAECSHVDNGIGSYEFWGAKCFDSNFQWEVDSIFFDSVIGHRDDGKEIRFTHNDFLDPLTLATLSADADIDLQQVIEELSDSSAVLNPINDALIALIDSDYDEQYEDSDTED